MFDFFPADNGGYTDPHRSSDWQTDYAEDGMVDEYEAIALAADPSRGDVYESTKQTIRDITGIDENDPEEQYTYFGLPSLAAAPNAFEEFQ